MKRNIGFPVRFAIIWTVFLLFFFAGKIKAQTTPVSNDTVYTFVEKMPQFPGGVAELGKFTLKNLHLEKGSVPGRIIVQFVVTSSGEITEIEVLQPEDDEQVRKASGN